MTRHRWRHFCPIRLTRVNIFLCSVWWGISRWCIAVQICGLWWRISVIRCCPDIFTCVMGRIQSRYKMWHNSWNRIGRIRLTFAHINFGRSWCCVNINRNCFSLFCYLNFLVDGKMVGYELDWNSLWLIIPIDWRTYVKGSVWLISEVEAASVLFAAGVSFRRVVGGIFV